MAWPNIDATSPANTDKVKFGASNIRALKSSVITALQKICNYQDNAGSVPALRTAVWTTATRPTGGDLVDRVTGYNTDLGCEEYYDLASVSWKKIGLNRNGDVFSGDMVWAENAKIKLDDNVKPLYLQNVDGKFQITDGTTVYFEVTADAQKLITAGTVKNIPISDVGGNIWIA